MMVRYAVFIVAVCLGFATSAHAWSTKEHLNLARLAMVDLIERDDTPADMKAWLRGTLGGDFDRADIRDDFIHKRHGIFPRGADGIPYWAAMPDLVADSSRPTDVVQPFGVHERKLHYIDVEFFMPDMDTPAFREDLSAFPPLSAIPRDMTDPRYKDAGMLPFRIEECYQRLIESLQAGRLNDHAGQYPRDEHAARWAGYLAHYLADSTQPHHGTIDYKSASFFPNPAIAPNIHAVVEYRLSDDDADDLIELRTEVWDRMEDALRDLPVEACVEGAWDRSLRTIAYSYQALPLIGHAARASWKVGDGESPGDIDVAGFYRFEGSAWGRPLTPAQMKAEQFARAIREMQAHWLSAWHEAHGSPAEAE